MSSEPIEAARRELVLALADDELMIGSRDMEWSGVAPLLEEDVALSAIAQDEIGHAIAFYELITPRHFASSDEALYSRSAREFRHARVLESQTADFAHVICRRFLYELADDLRLGALESSSWPELAGLATTLRKEEELHHQHALSWVRLLGSVEPGRSRLKASFTELLPASLDILAPLPCEPELLASGLLSHPFRELQERWIADVGTLLAPLGLSAELDSMASHTDRYREPSPALHSFFDELWAVRSLSREGTWYAR
jgi:ring-1,2-phenylacetyl-CoA epoxidase subunit PaaC